MRTNLIKRFAPISNISHQVRTYVAAAHATSVKIPARIKQHQEVVHLQVLTSQKIGPNLHYDKTWRDYFFGSSWHTLLKIDNKTQGVSLEDTQIKSGFSYDKAVFMPPEHIIFPEHLFGIPQEIWEAFLGHLEHQGVVQGLCLKQHRHLWPAYSYALSAPTADVMTARAHWIGRFHFLLSIALYKPEEIEQYTQDKRRNFQFSFLNDIKHDLDQGRFDENKMLKIHAGFTRLFLKKLRHCSNILDLNLLAALVSNFAKTTLEPFDMPRQLGAINRLPCSTTDPHRFASSLTLAKKIHEMSARPGLLFFNSQSQWAAYTSKAGSINDLGTHYLNALFDDLIRRQLILQAHAAHVLIDSDLLHIVKERFESFFMQDIGFHHITALQQYWQHNSHTITSVKPSPNKEKFWSPLIDNTEISGVSIRSLASEDALIRHGKTMRHCVQTELFVDSCRDKEIDILELVSKDGELSTLDLRRGGDDAFYKMQHVSVGGVQSPSQLHLEAGIKLVEQMRVGHIHVSKARQMEDINHEEKSAYHFEYDLEDLVTQEQIYQVYKAKKMLPKRLIFANYQEMLSTTQLVNIIDDVLAKMMNTERDSSPSFTKA
ncbi:MAG: hypothetical protein CK424_07215 [Legionella sp.]|nr:MAG: hypothetical protein CK424_07215 [Legionella sp.]